MKQKIVIMLLGFLFVLALVAGLVPGISIPAHAAAPYTYEFTTTRFCFWIHIITVK